VSVPIFDAAAWLSFAHARLPGRDGQETDATTWTGSLGFGQSK
jgi:hypothetical protein